MEKFGIITNSLKDPDGQYARKVEEKLRKLVPGAQILSLDLIEDELTVPADTEAVIVMGGDGSMLKVAIALRKLDIPLLGINLGNVGYLTEVEITEVDGALEQLVSGSFTIENRMMLAGCTVLKGVRSELDHALNDIVLSRRGDIQLAGYRVSVNGVFLSDFYADGIIISSPTGSTGYNISAGGPIVEPSARLMVLTPVAPHTLKTRSIVLSDEDHIRVELLPARTKSGTETEAGAYFDGVNRGILGAGDSVEVRKSIRVCRIIKLGDDGFLQVVQKKLS